MELKRLGRPEKPWLHVLVATASDAYDLLQSLPDTLSAKVVSRVIRGQKATTTADLFDEVAAALQFPPYFGENWDAFDDCITDLEWLAADGYALLILDSIHLLEKEPADQQQLLLKVLEDAGAEWSQPGQGAEPRPPRPFHVVLQCTQPDEEALRHQLQAAKVGFNHLQ